MNVQHTIDPVLQRTVRRASPSQWILPVLVAATWLMALYLWGSADMLHWAGSNIGAGLRLLTAGAALYLFPGLAVLSLLWPDRSLTLAERLTLAGGVSVGLPPLLLQFAHLLGISWSPTATLIYVGVAAIVLASTISVRWRRQTLQLPDVGSWHGWLLASLMAVVLLTRFFVIRDLPVGMWGDSYHHTMIAQLLVDNRGLFTSWLPYVPLTTFSYHFGFHANAAFFHWLSGEPVTQSVLLVGQIANVLSVAAAYAFTTRLSGSRSAGLWSIALTAFVNILPAYFVNWGRYTQLTGHVLLVPLMLAWLSALGTQRLSMRHSLLAILLTASLMLTHYVVTIFAALSVLALIVALWMREPTWRNVGFLGGRSITYAVCALLLATPWLLNVMQGYLARNVARHAVRHAESGYGESLTALLPLWPLYLSLPVVVLSAAGVIAALVRRHWWMLLCIAWAVLIVASTSPHVIGLPGRGVVNMPAAYMALYVVVIPLAGYALHVAVELIARRRQRTAFALVTVGMVGMSMWGMQPHDLIAEEHMLFTRADARAMEWITTNTPTDARFLVDMFPAYNDSLFVGSDAGWWIPLLTGRQTTLPPINYVSERTEPADYREQIDALAWALRQHPLPSDEGRALLRVAGISYVYSGAHDDPQRTIDRDALRQHPAFRVVYDHDDVVIFSVEGE